MTSPRRAAAKQRPYPAAARSLLRDTVLGAVDDLVRTRGWAATTMADVAAAAGVSRQTLYNEFGSRSSLIENYVGREIQALIAEVSTAVREHAGDAHVALRTAFELFLRLASDEPVVQLIVSDAEQGELVRMLITLGQSLAEDNVVALITDVWPQAAVADARLLAGSLVRLAISHALVPVADASSVAAGVSRMLAPFVDQALGASGA